MSRSLLVLLAVFAALTVAGCGGGDGGDGGVDIDAFESCLKDDGLDVGREDDTIESLDAQPVALFLIEGASQTDFGIAVPVAVFESEDDAQAAEESLGADGPLGSDRSGSVVWVFPNVNGQGIEDDVSATLRSCAEDAS